MADNEVPTDEQILTQIEILMKTVDLYVMSIAQFIAALSDKLGGADLSAKNEFIKDNITEILDAMESAREKKLFTQPESTHLGECPLCFLPMPTDRHQIIMNSCCSKLQCNGCAYAHQKREMSLGLEQSCAFCRKPLQKNEEEEIANKMERVEANDAVAIREIGCHHEKQGDYAGAFECYSKAAGLGDIEAHFLLSTYYADGTGVEKNIDKEIYHSEEAAMGGHLGARHNLGIYESISGNTESAVKHWIIAANLGNDESMKTLREDYARGNITKEVYAATLRSYQDAVVGMKSVQRKEAVDAEW